MLRFNIGPIVGRGKACIAISRHSLDSLGVLHSSQKFQTVFESKVAKFVSVGSAMTSGLYTSLGFQYPLE